MLAFSTLLINARHILMGASLAPKVGALRPWQRALAFEIMADENWALMERRTLNSSTQRKLRLRHGRFLLGRLAGLDLCRRAGGLVPRRPPCVGRRLPRSAPAVYRAHRRVLEEPGTAARACVKPRSGFGWRVVDLVAGFWKGSATGATVVASGLAAALAYKVAGPPWHVAAGAVAGISVAALLGGRDEDEKPSVRRATERKIHWGDGPMIADPQNIAAIVAMAVVTYATRASGLFIAHRLELTGRLKAAFDEIPAAVLSAVIAPSSMLATGWPETVAAALTMVAAFRLPLLGTVGVGVVSVVVLRWIAG